jgi:hypothetical protein
VPVKVETLVEGARHLRPANRTKKMTGFEGEYVLCKPAGSKAVGHLHWDAKGAGQPASSDQSERPEENPADLAEDGKS